MNCQIEFMQSNYFIGVQIVIAHCLLEDMANYLAYAIRSLHPKCKIDIMNTSGVCNYYAKQGGFIRI